ncbi:MAG: D-alanyl-D-alanine carboxypeptidase/D-alanyl-D-alanine-endopeptidase [Gemmatimonadaceae bacterium]
MLAARLNVVRRFRRCPGVRLHHGAALVVAAFALAASTASAQSAATNVEDAALTRSAAPTADAARESKTRKTRTTRRASLRRKALPALRYATPYGTWSLASSLDTLLGARVRTGTWGVLVVSLTKGDTLYATNADTRLLPASTMKLFTTALAFDRLGPQHQFSTQVLRDGALSADGTLVGNLILRGDGDPGFSNRFIPGDQNAPMRALARQVAAAGVRRVQGNLIGDATAFEAKRIPDGWSPRNAESSFGQRVSALSLNENLLHVAISPGSGKGPARITLEPGTVAYKVENETRTVAGSRKSKLTVSRKPDGTVVARGWIGSNCEVKVYVVVVDDPALFATGAFRQALRDEGIEVTGELVIGTTPPRASAVATLASPPLAQLASVMNRESVNHFAELIFRDAARTGDPTGVGSAATGNTLLQQLLVNRAGASRDAVFAADGSGLSTLDRVTPRALVQLLAFADKAPWSREFHESLPVAGTSELLRHRMRATPAEGNLHAKTGTTDQVIALGGYVMAQNGERLAFSFLYNGRERWTARETIDAMGGTLAAFVR